MSRTRRSWPAVPEVLQRLRARRNHPDRPFETFEKVDGSLIILFWHAGEWRTATKGTFGSAQASWAAERLRGCDLSALSRGTTYLAEAVYAENRIVVRYDQDELVLLAAYDGPVPSCRTPPCRRPPTGWVGGRR